MKISEVTLEDVLLYTRIDDVEPYSEGNVPQIIFDSAKAFLRGQTGLTDEEMDQYEDLTIAFCMVAAEFYDTRAYHLEASKVTVNPAAAAIINQHCRTLL